MLKILERGERREERELSTQKNLRLSALEHMNMNQRGEKEEECQRKLPMRKYIARENEREAATIIIIIITTAKAIFI